MSFVPLHVHTDASLLDGIGRAEAYAARAAELGMSALSVTDHGTLAGVPQVVDACRRHGLKPILGMEAYLAVGGRFEHRSLEGGLDSEGESAKSAYHLTLIAATPTGWRNLVALHNASWDSVYRGKPRIDWDLLEGRADGLICLTGCLGGPVLSPLVRGRRAKAEENLDRLVGIFGAGHVFVELMEHGIATEAGALPELVDLARSRGLTCVVSNDCHYVSPDQSRAHEAWLAKQRRTTLADPRRWTFPGGGYHLMSEAEARGLRAEDWWQEAVSNTALVADMVEDNVLPAPRLRLPVPEVPSRYKSLTAWVVDWARHGARKRYGDPIPEAVRERLNTELEVFKGKGMVGYAALVGEMIAWAKGQGIVVGPGRGSGGGSVLLYCLGITDVDPLESGTLFERFLDPQRAGMPDVDTDFERGRREEVYQHLVQVYGADRVVRLGTEMVSGVKASLKDAASQLGMSAAWANRLTRTVPDEAGSVEELLSEPIGEAFRKVLESCEGDAEALTDLACSFQGVRSAASTHACGVIVADEDLTDLVPTRVDGGNRVTCWDGPTCEAMGLVKLDLLGLRTLDQIRVACDIIGISPADVPRGRDVGPDDPVWQMLADGETASVFQLESGGMADLCQALAPRSEDDLTALGALYRPGPMGAGMHLDYADRLNGRAGVSYDTFTTDEAEAAALDEVLAPTQGLIVYQETIMALGRVVGGFTASGTNALRKAVAKKHPEEIERLGRLFVAGAEREVDDDGAPKKAFSAATARRLWEAIESAGRYSFNKCLLSTTPIDKSDGSTVTAQDLADHLAGGGEPVPVVSVQPDGTLTTALAVSATYSGTRQVVRVLAGGHDLTLTPGHRLGTTEGLVEAGRLMPSHHQVLTLAPDGTSLEPVTVEAVEDGGTHPTFDVELDPASNHLLVAGGMVAHNSHAVAYGRITFTTAWLKAHHPAAFGAATLAVTDDDERRAAALRWLGERGVTVLPPDVGAAGVATTATDCHTVVLGLGEVRDVGSAAAAIVAERAKGPYTSVTDLAERTRLSAKAVEALAKAGALDRFGPRAGLATAARALVKAPVPVPDLAWEATTTAMCQLEVLGTFTGTPLVEDPDVAGAVSDWSSAGGWRAQPLAEVETMERGTTCVAGMIASVSERVGPSWRLRTLRLTDGRASVEVACWGELHDATEDLLPGQVVVVTASVRRREGALSLMARDVEVVEAPTGLVRRPRDAGVDAVIDLLAP